MSTMRRAYWLIVYQTVWWYASCACRETCLDRDQTSETSVYQRWYAGRRIRITYTDQRRMGRWWRLSLSRERFTIMRKQPLGVVHVTICKDCHDSIQRTAL